MYWASRAPDVMDSAVAVPAADSERSTSAASDLICETASDEADTSVVWASRALLRIDMRVQVRSSRYASLTCCCAST